MCGKVESGQITHFRYLKVEVEANSELNEPISQMFADVLGRLKSALANETSTSSRYTLNTIHSQKVKATSNM